MPKELPDSPDRLQLTRIHYMCPKCLSDIYRDTRQQTVICKTCGKSWCPGTYRPDTFAWGIEETNPHSARYDFPRCAKHGIPRCKDCEKAELYAE